MDQWQNIDDANYFDLPSSMYAYFNSPMELLRCVFNEVEYLQP